MATIRDFLLTYQQQNRAPDLLIALDPNGRVLARTDSAQPDPIVDVDTKWVKPALSAREVIGALRTQHGVYNAAAVVSEAGGTAFGFVLAGSRVDNALAHTLGDSAHAEIVILDRSVLGSTLRESPVPWRSLFQGEHAAINAIRCAAAIHNAIEGHNAMLPAEEPTIGLGIGITTGEVILGSKDRRDFTAIGSHVNLCSRLCSLAGSVANE